MERLKVVASRRFAPRATEEGDQPAETHAMHKDAEPARQTSLSSWRFHVLIALVSLAAVVLSARQAIMLEPTLDEAFSWRLSRYPLPELLAATASDVHPPLHYLVLKGWGRLFGDHMLALRSFSLVMRVVSIWLIHHTVLAASSLIPSPHKSLSMCRGAGLLAAVLLALSPFHIEAGGSARMYGLMVVLTLCSHYCFFRGVRVPQSRGWWLGWGAALGASCLTHNGGVLLACAHGGVSFLWRLRELGGRQATRTSGVPRVPARALLLGGVTAAAIYAPWVPSLLWQVHVVRRGYWIGHLGLADVVETFQPWFTAVPYSGVRLAVLVVVPHALLLGCLIRRQWICGLLAVQALLPWLLVVGISISWNTSILQLRYLLFAHVSLLILWGLGMLVLHAPVSRLWTVWLLISSAVAGMLEMPLEKRVALSATFDILEQRAGGDDVILTEARIVNLMHYHLAMRRMEGVQVLGVPDAPLDTDRHVVHAASLKPWEFIAGDQLGTLRHDRIWTITFPLRQPIAPPLDPTEFHEVTATDGGRYRLTCYRAKSPPGER
jgi:hypothetical protein